MNAERIAAIDQNASESRSQFSFAEVRELCRLARLGLVAEELAEACDTVVSVIRCLDVESDPRQMYRLGQPTMTKLHQALAAYQLAKEKS